MPWINYQNKNEIKQKEKFNFLISKRLEIERHKTFWNSGVLRGGDPTIRRGWILQRLNENSEIKLANIFLEK